MSTEGHIDSYYAATASPAPRRPQLEGELTVDVCVVGGGLSGCSTKGQALVAGGVERLVSINVNGELRRVDVLPQETLAMTLRYKLGLTGTKLGCDRAECGACTSDWSAA